MSPADFDRWLLEETRPPLVMGVLNVTPDSFSDGGKFSTTDAAIAHAEQMAAAGAEVAGFLDERIVTAGIHGVRMEQILIDPGIGFGKNRAHNLELIRRLRELTVLGRPLVVGVSRKRFIGEITHEPDPQQRLFGTAA